MRARSRRSLDRLAALRSLLTLSDDDDYSEKKAEEEKAIKEKEAAVRQKEKAIKEKEEKDRREREAAALAMMESESDSEEEIPIKTTNITSLLRASYVPIRTNTAGTFSRSAAPASKARSSIFEYPQYADYKKIDEEEKPATTASAPAAGDVAVLSPEEKKKIENLRNDELKVYSYDVLRVQLFTESDV